MFNLFISQYLMLLMGEIVRINFPDLIYWRQIVSSFISLIHIFIKADTFFLWINPVCTVFITHNIYYLFCRCILSLYSVRCTLYAVLCTLYLSTASGTPCPLISQYRCGIHLGPGIFKLAYRSLLHSYSIKYKTTFRNNFKFILSNA